MTRVVDTTRFRLWYWLAVIAVTAAGLLMPASVGQADGTPATPTLDSLYCPSTCCSLECRPGKWMQHTYTCPSSMEGSCEYCSYTCYSGPIEGPLYQEP